MVRDWALHQQWLVERDCIHPERPSRLLKVQWTSPERGRASPQADSARTGLEIHAGVGPVIRPGMRVILSRSNREAEIHLGGVALQAGRLGETILVKAGLSATALRGTVRGPGLVELEPEKGRH